MAIFYLFWGNGCRKKVRKLKIKKSMTSLWSSTPRRKQSFIRMNQRKLLSKQPTSIRLTEVRRLKGQRLPLRKTRSFGGVRFIRLIRQRKECLDSTGSIKGIKQSIKTKNASVKVAGAAGAQTR